MSPFAKDGHSLFSSGIKIWEPLVSEFRCQWLPSIIKK
jgi:hypothetical protein